MRISTLLTLVCATFVTGAVLTACGDDDEKGPAAAPFTPSKAGESCNRTADCDTGLACVNNICQTGSTGAGGEGSGPVTGGGEEGETCGSRGDCAPGLLCIDSTCTESAGSGGEGNVPTGRAGGIGETCMNVRDCAETLTCIPFGAVGVCDLEEYGLEPTGNSCTGECKAPADCCELPQGITIIDPITGGIASIFSCADLTAYIAGANCAMAGLVSNIDTACFYQATYCGNCAAAMWACTNNKCVYGADCNNNGDVKEGCPTRTRAGAALTATCDVNGTGKCSAPAGMGCTTDASCNNQVVADSGGADSCSVGECTCFSSGCYRKCDENLDCPFRFECDMADHVCVPIGACATNSECASSMGDVRARCAAGACVIPCANDHECSGSGAGNLPFFNTQVCSAAGVCQVVGCSADDECGVGQAAGQPHLFCTPVAAPRPGGAVSAITD